MGIGTLCNREPVYVDRDVTVNAATKLMRHYQVGSLVVVDDVGGKRTPVGMVTDRDIIVEVYAMDLDAQVLTAGDIMSQTLVTAPESLGVLDTLALMRAKRVRRVPIVDGENQLTGIVAIDDLLGVLADELSDISRIVSREHIQETQRRPSTAQRGHMIMDKQIQISVRGMAHSAALDTHIREKFAKLEQVYALITSCRVVAEAPHSHGAHGGQHAVKLDITVPGSEIVVSHCYDEDINVALRDAFDAATVQLERYAQMRRGDRRNAGREVQPVRMGSGAEHE